MGCASSAALASASIHPGSSGSRSIVKDAECQTTVTVRIAASANSRDEAHTVRKEQIAMHHADVMSRAYEMSNEKGGFTTTTGSCMSTPRSAYSRTRKVQGSQESGGSENDSRIKSVGFSSSIDDGNTARNNRSKPNKSQVSFRNEEYNQLVKGHSKHKKPYSSSARDRPPHQNVAILKSNLGKRNISTTGSHKSESSGSSDNKQADTGYEGSDEYQMSQPSSSTKSLLINSPQVPVEALVISSTHSIPDTESSSTVLSDGQTEHPEVSRSLSKISENMANIENSTLTATANNIENTTLDQSISETETITQNNSFVDELICENGDLEQNTEEMAVVPETIAESPETIAESPVVNNDTNAVIIVTNGNISQSINDHDSETEDNRTPEPYKELVDQPIGSPVKLPKGKSGSNSPMETDPREEDRAKQPVGVMEVKPDQGQTFKTLKDPEGSVSDMPMVS